MYGFNIIRLKIYSAIILSAVLYAYETWSLTLRDERRLEGFEENIWVLEGRGNRGVEKTK